ncbi:hypothetical protein SAMD00019534_119070, partial [Acytostelium subglobosum LB1]|uniref:hypothetical protein n=1 Tax=Acytostelium subglobosum LB1 TaxID=1410327 RepID=UPI0006448078
NLSEWNHYWERCVGSGHAWLGTRQDWRDALTIAREKLGFQRVRFHGIFDDDMNVYQELPNGQVQYSFYNVDQVYDFLLSIGVEPLVELSFMPTPMSSGTQTIFHYKANITPPKDYKLWSDMIVAFLEHLIDRYSFDVVKSWYFEVWNEPNCGFWTGNQTEYFTMLQVTSDAVKSVSQELMVGGPATCQSQWLQETLDFVKDNNVALDFVSTHEYPTDIEPLQRGIMRQVLNQSRNTVGQSMPLFYTEYNDGLLPQVNLHDNTYAATFAIFNVIDVYGFVDIFSWWTFSDIFEEQGQQSVPFNEGFGLQTIYNIPKPSFKAFELLHETGQQRALVTGDVDHPTVGLLVTTDDEQQHDEISIIVYNYNIPNGTIESASVLITLENLPTNRYDATLRRIDQDNCNPLATWQRQGSPTYPTRTQIDELQESAEFRVENIQFKVLDSSTIQFKLDLSPISIAAITIIKVDH